MLSFFRGSLERSGVKNEADGLNETYRVLFYSIIATSSDNLQKETFVRAENQAVQLMGILKGSSINGKFERSMASNINISVKKNRISNLKKKKHLTLSGHTSARPHSGYMG